jgi:hypothetical protein
MTASLTSEAWPTLTGRQEPHHLSFTDGDTTHGEKAVLLKERIGVAVMPWQREAQLRICSTTPASRWTHPTVCLLCTRQNGKSEILIDRCIYGLFKLGETILYTAQRWKTARDAWKRTMALIKRRAWLRKHVVRSTCSQGEGIIELDTGALISFGTRSADAGRGLTVIDLIIYDEAYNLTEAEISAMSFTQMAARNPQRIYASSAVNQDQHANGAVLSAVRRRGLNREPRLYFAEWMAPCDIECCEMCALAGVMDRDDMATVEYANPSFGVIQTAEKVADIKADLTTEAGRKSFDVEALGRGDWPADDTERPHIVDMSVWGSRVDRDPVFVGSPVIGVSLAPDHKTWAVGAAWRTEADRIHAEVGMWAAATHDEVLRFLSAVVAEWDPAAVVMDARSQAMVITSKLQAIGIDPELLNTPAMAGACGAVLDDIDSGMWSHSGQPELDLAVDVVQLRDLPQGDFVFNPRQQEAIPLIAVTLAHQGVIRFASRVETPASPAFAAAPGPTGPSARRDLDLLTVAF